MKLTIYKSFEQVSSANYEICVGILLDQGLRFEQVVNIKQVMVLSCGKMNPSNGFVIIPPNEPDKVITDYFGLMNWINEKGLRQI
jgi:hypothetical protein